MIKPVVASYDVMPQAVEPIVELSEPDVPCQPEGHDCDAQEGLRGDVALVDWLHHGDGLSFTIVTQPDFQPLVVPLGNPDVTVDHLVAAEIGMLPSLHYVEVLDPASGNKLDHSVKLRGQCVLTCCGSDCEALDEAPEVQALKMVDGYESGSPSFDEISPTLFFALEPDATETDVPGIDLSPSKKKPRVDCLPDSSALPSPLVCDQEATAVVMEPLVKLKPHQLLALAPPVISSMQVFHSMIKPSMSALDRIEVLEAQGTAWADDEVRWHITQVITKANRPGVVFLDPLIATECLVGTGDKLLHDWLLTLPEKPKILLSAVCVNEHWTPFAWTYASDCLQANSWDLQASVVNTKLFNQLHDKISKALGCRTFLSRVLHRSIATAEGCGVCAIRFLDYFLRAKMLPTSNSEVEQLHNDGKSMFLAHLQLIEQVERPWSWGFGLDPQVSDRLHLLLEQHGVPKDQCEQRAFVIQQALGTQALQKAMIGTSPWRSIKALANQLRPPLQLILPDELQASIQAKAGQKGDGKRRKKQETKNNSAPAKPPPLDPVKLRFDDGAFVSDTGSPLQQIQVGQLGPLIEGVALATLGSVEQFLRSGAVVSKGHLAVFVLNADEASMTTRLPWALSRVALRCVANNEPMLIQGFVVQLGSKFVQQGKARHEVEVEDVGAACVKFAIYRDQVASWDEVVAGPVKHLLGVLEMLVPCQGHDDDQPCSKWHPGKESSVRDPVFDVWRRQWLSLSMQACQPSQASIFMVNVRYAKVLETAVLAQSGQNGLYMEPRSLDAKSAVLDYQVIWLPRKSMPEILHIRQTNPCVLGIARLGSRMGVRVKVADAQLLSKALRPESILLPSGPRMDFELGPLPYGLDRSGVAGLCKSWGWIAKPVNPSRSVVGDLGTIWLVQSCVDPPSSVFSLKGNDVVVTKIQSKQAKDSTNAQPTVASPATLSLCAFDPVGVPAGTDPWLQSDPWGYDASKSKIAKAVPTDISLNLQQIEERIEQSVLAKMPRNSCAMDIDDSSSSTAGTDAFAHQDARIIALESQVNRLMSGHQVLEQKVDESTRKTEAQISQVQHQMSAQLEAQGSKIEDLFQSQLNRLESLLSKKARME